jgi:hypothetical protein
MDFTTYLLANAIPFNLTSGTTKEEKGYKVTITLEGKSLTVNVDSLETSAEDFIELAREADKKSMNIKKKIYGS